MSSVLISIIVPAYNIESHMEDYPQQEMQA